MSVSIIVKGIDSTIRFLNDKSGATEKEITKAMVKIGVLMESEVKKSIAGYKEGESHVVGTEHISVDTGRFLNSVLFNANKDSVIIFSDIEYAKKLEYGIGYHLSPRAHFRNSKYRNKQKIQEIIQENVSNI